MKDEQFDVLMWKLEEIRTGIVDVESEVQGIKEVLLKKDDGVFIGDIVGDLSDIGNNIGIAIGRHIDDKLPGFDKDSFLHGINHGIDISKRKDENGKDNNKD